MSRDLFEIFESINHNELEKQIAMQCAPLLTGVKISNLLIVDKRNRQEIINIFNETSISYYIMHENDSKITFLLYSEPQLIKYLDVTEAQMAMKIFGYRSFDLRNILNECSSRYEKFMLRENDFPHELGIILGYPVEDVLGFVENNGKDYLYSGYWKVYSNLEAKIKLFNLYNEAKKSVINMISQGLSITNILDINYLNEYSATKIA